MHTLDRLRKLGINFSVWPTPGEETITVRLSVPNGQEWCSVHETAALFEEALAKALALLVERAPKCGLDAAALKATVSA